jgi:hypothetical protein
MPIRPHRSAPLALLALAVTGWCCAESSAQSSTAPMPLHRKTAGVLVSDLANDRLLYVRDLDGDGVATGTGEVSVFFDASNASGISTPTGAIFCIYQAANGTVYIGDGDTRAIYALRDNNLNGTANDAGEARVFFNQALSASGIFLPTPNGLAGDANAIYVTNAGTTNALPSSQDGIIRLADGNADQDAQSLGEATLFLDGTTLIAAGATSSNPFDLCILNNALYFSDFRSTALGGRAIMRAAYTPTTTSIGAADLNVFVTNQTSFNGPSGAFTLPLGQSCVADGTSIYMHDTSAANVQAVYRLTDGNASDTINADSEIVQVWSELNLPVGEVMSNSFDIDVGPRRLLVTSNGSTPASQGSVPASELIIAIDADNNGLFSQAETKILIKGANAVALWPANTNSRTARFYGWPCAADFNLSGSVTVNDIFDFLTAWFAGDIRADVNGANAISVQDIFDFLASWFAGCP